MGYTVIKKGGETVKRKGRSVWREGRTVGGIVLVSALVATGLHVFVYRANFAPSGVDGLAAMLQYLSVGVLGYKINAGVFTLVLNLPLLLIAWVKLRRRYVLYTLVYTLTVSLTLPLLDAVSFYQYDVIGGAGNPVLAALFGGCAQGLTGILLRLGGSSGGADVIGCLIQRRHPHRDLERLIALVSYAVVALSFFVYRDLGSVLLSVVSIYACERVSATFLRTRRGGIRAEIVTSEASLPEVRRVLLAELRHGATLLSGRGMYAGEEKRVIVCLVTYRDLSALLRCLSAIPDVFCHYGEALGVIGPFDFEPEK